MRGSIPSILLAAALLLGGPAHAQGPSEAETGLDALRRHWHRCVRQTFSGQPASVEKRAAERAALAACKGAEDAYVAAELAARAGEARSGEVRPGEDRGRGGLTTRARAWISSVAAYVVDPVASWFGGLGR